MNPETWDDSPIVALSSGPGPTALSVIRLSGIKDFKKLQAFFSKDLSALAHKSISRSEFKVNDRVIDDLCFSYFKQPHSFTGESVLELYCHGNDLIVNEIISNLCSLDGYRLAYPGEFSYRAFKNKKMSLSQVEGLDVFIKSGSPLIKDMSYKILQGELSAEYLQLWDSFKHLKSCMEVFINFSEDVGEDQSLEAIRSSFAHFSEKLNRLHQRCELNPDKLLSPKIVLSGPVNAGKSSLFNWFVGSDRAIVSNQQGTTRDYIVEYSAINQTKFQFIDTAGLRDTQDEVEKIGIEYSKSLTRQAFFNILVLNPHELVQLEPYDVDAIVLTHLDKAIEVKVLSSIIEAYSKAPIFGCDLSGPIEPLSTGKTGPIEPLKFLKNGPIGPKSGSGPIEPLDKLKEKISNKFNGLCAKNPILINRHVHVIKNMAKKSESIGQMVEDFVDAGIFSHEINALEEELSELIGVITSAEVLDNVFDNFCIGK